MNVLIDANVLLRIAQAASPQQQVAQEVLGDIGESELDVVLGAAGDL